MPKSAAVGEESASQFWNHVTFFAFFLLTPFLMGVSMTILFVLPQVLPHHLDLGLFSVPIALLLFPAELILLDVLVLSFALFLKLLLIGRFREDLCPFGSFYSFRRALPVALPFSLHVIPLIAPETPLIIWLHRMLGVRVGYNVLIRSGLIHVDEFDLGTIGDHSVIEPFAHLQTHTSENRVFKFAPVTVGSHCHIGYGSIVMPYQHVDHHVVFKPMTCGLPAEYFPPHTSWAGVPPSLVDKQSV
eukprot:TRINITY_DN13102_c0_g1_i1.p1 TRINITY_DN13102_c0_g1~~TRINITY_DN13102_c0_g1_i1.p1  ORF type:complete len:245 (+),score=76.12 TRINITY_DN13102_c0_g1_i1:247-981(+)